MKKLKPSELKEKIDEISKKVLEGNETPWVIFPSVKLTEEDFEKYSKIKNIE